MIDSQMTTTISCRKKIEGLYCQKIKITLCYLLLTTFTYLYLYLKCMSEYRTNCEKLLFHRKDNGEKGD